MLFVEFQFFQFFALVFIVHWALRSNLKRKLWLLAASYVFYAAWDWRFLSLIIVSTLIDYVVSRQLVATESQRRRKAWLALSVTANLGILGFFKYFNFFVESAVSLSNAVGLPVQTSTMNIILPVGISFYTFQTLSYSIDVYRRQIKPTRNLLDLALFVGFFPQLVAGPIVRASHFLPQLRMSRVWSDVKIRPALTLFLLGFVKKACISDSLAPVVDSFFAAPDQYTHLTAWLGVLFYAAQIYCDFSGYTDMAIACASLLGYELCVNFNAPYVSRSVTEFWRRWHISLSTWLRDYLYVPLGGNRNGTFAMYRNLMIVMLLGGLWHGAAWHFVIWGGLHGAMLAGHKYWTGLIARHDRLRPLPTFIAWPMTFGLICLTWVVFRASDLATMSTIVQSCLFLTPAGTTTIGFSLAWLLPCLGLLHYVERDQLLYRTVEALPPWGYAASHVFVTTVALTFMPTGYHPFIYFQF